MADDNPFLGTGWSFPPAFGAGGASVQMVSGLQDIEQSLAILLSTRQGERVLQDEFGCELGGFLFAEMSEGLVGQVRSVISAAIVGHEPRVVLNSVEVDASEDTAGLLLIAVDYTVRATNSRFNMVFPFYLNEASSVAA